MIALGPFKIENPFILAPMAGITNSPYRRLMRRHRSAVVVSELVSSTGMEYLSQKTIQLLRFHESERPVGLQIFGYESTHLVNAAKKIEELGADFVDLNLGCPVPKVVNKGGGAALCRNPFLLGRLLAEMKSSIQIPLTIKIRLGWDSHHINAQEVVDVATDSGVSWVAIHGRTRAQGYSGQSDWEKIAEIKSKSQIPIIGNGDLVTPDLALQRLNDSGVDAVMIGRGALRNPFIFEQCEQMWKGDPVTEVNNQKLLDLITEHRNYLEETFSGAAVALHAKKFISWYSTGYPGCHEFRRQVFQSNDPQALWDLTEKFFETIGRSRDSAFLNQPFLMGGHG